MSYDLYFATGSKPRAEDAFFDHFRERPNNAIEGCQAWYRNDDTGVYFLFESADPTDEAMEDAIEHWATFNLNYLRPHFFASEALPELEAFVSELELTVHDPQIDGMGDGSFSADGFLRGW